jgi:endonuclease/exonuclease/phosphatase family metal-dependent hydrolase
MEHDRHTRHQRHHSCTIKYGEISIFNIYNDCTHDRNESFLRNYLQEHANELLATVNHHMIWAGDFNRHHPLWDRDEDTHLFTQQANEFAQGLIGLVATYDLAMALPKGIPTLQHMVTGRYSRPDNVFTTTGLTELIVRCEVDPTLRPTSTDHFPIITNILLPQEKTIIQPHTTSERRTGTSSEENSDAESTQSRTLQPSTTWNNSPQSRIK